MSRYFKFAFVLFFLFSYHYLNAEDKPSSSENTALSVTQARMADNKAKVILIGMIVQRDHDYYLRDLTGQVKLEIPRKIMSQINMASKVRIEGIIKTNFLRYISKSVDPTIRVKSIEIFKPKPKTSEIDSD
ncbi:MAG TPA: hypothetical protein DD381_06185 [Lentisphaeria bacterium]|nr:MAG: hypothetical protein A2X47_05230 [Lentisphaerae bacterium GWF2_38_69]HBM15915.1 hypothetical protein [Lentisphaeria bacterium]